MLKGESSITGRNFSGKAKIIENLLTLDLTQFRKGTFYQLNLTSEDISKDPKRFLVFRKKEELYQEILHNKKMEICDENKLRIPVKVSYKGKQFEIEVEIPLIVNNKLSWAEEKKALLDLIEKLSAQPSSKIQQSDILPVQLKFQRDLANRNSKLFEVNGKLVRMLRYSSCLIFNHSLTLPERGIYYFQFKVIKSHNNIINFGVCAESIKSKIDACEDPLFMGYELGSGQLEGNGKSLKVVNPKYVEQGSIIKVEIDMTRRQLKWYSNGKLLHAADFWKQLEGVKLCPFISLFHYGDVVEILSM